MLPLFLFLLSEPSLAILWSRPLQEYDLFKAQDRAVIAVSESGRILLVDSEEPRLLFLNETGDVLASIGKKGAGPGEFSYPTAAGWSPRLRAFQVFDYRAQRLSCFDEEGNFLRDFKPPEFIRNPAFASDRLLYTLRGEDGGQSYRAFKLCNTSEGSIREMWRHPMTGGAILEWTPILSYAAGARFLAVNHGDEPYLHLIDFEGKERNRIKIDVPRMPLTGAYFEERIAILGNNPKFASMGITIEKVEYWPYFHNMLIDDHDRIWLFLHRERPTQPRGYYLYNHRGESLGSGRHDGNAQIFSGPYLFSIRENQDGDLFLEKMEITNSQ